MSTNNKIANIIAMAKAANEKTSKSSDKFGTIGGFPEIRLNKKSQDKLFGRFVLASSDATATFSYSDH